MKFARYLDENCTQEWKRAYIDYKRLKKCIKAVRAAQAARAASPQQPPGSLKRGESSVKKPRDGTDGEHGTDPQREPNDAEFGETSDRQHRLNARVEAQQQATPDETDGDESKDDDDDSDESDRVDQGPWAGPKPRFDKGGSDEGGSKHRFWFPRSPMIGLPQGGRGSAKPTPVMNGGSPAVSANTRGSPATPSTQRVERTPRQYGAIGQTPLARRRRDPSPPPPLHLPEASAPMADDVSQNHISLRTPTAVSPDSSPDEPDEADQRTSDSTSNEDKVGPLLATPRTLIRKRPETPVRSPSLLRFGRAKMDDARDHGSSPVVSPVMAPAGVSGTQHLSSAPSKPRQSEGSFYRSPRIQSALGSLRRATMTGTDPLPPDSVSKASIVDDRSGVRFPGTLEQLYDCLYPEEAKFFDVLDGQLEKVDNFYQERLDEAIKRCKELRLQLQELGEHRRIFHEAEHNGRIFPRRRAVKDILPATAGAISNSVQRLANITRPDESAAGGENSGRNGRGHSRNHSRNHSRGQSRSDSPRINGTHANGQAEKGSIRQERVSSSSNVSASGGPESQPSRRARFERQPDFSPELYQKYKRKLRLAVLEYYKELEVLKNYRILNVTGFKKALKKFEKTAKIRCLDMYMNQKVGTSSFSDATVLDGLIKEMEDEYTIRFEKGNHKKAVTKLRGQFSATSHHYSTFLSGAYLGLGLPALVLGLVRSFDPAVRAELPQYNALLQVYSIFLIPVVFAVLFELNLCAFVAARINYTFIMEIDIRTAIDYRVFLEIPALLFLVLSYCFYFSITRVGEPAISPFAWPVVWLVFLVAFFLNPIPVYYQHARYWLLSVIARVLTPGYSRVEFIAFFVADEMNSLTYSIANLWFFGCTYRKGWSEHPDMYSVCSASGNWVYTLLLMLPAFIRAIQCLKRYKDSRLPIHLINCGKYGSVMLQLALFSNWRARGWKIADYSFAIWVVAAVFSSLYTSAWDLFVDWGLLRPRYGYLRESLGFPAYKNLYYMAMVTNVIIRFVWIGYIPRSGFGFRIRAFAFAMLEMLRRWQWNFLRVETEQVGNTDQYRISKDIPLPYRLEMDDSDDELVRTMSRTSAHSAHPLSLRNAADALGRLRKRVTDRGMRSEGIREVGGEPYVPGARGPKGTINAGPRGDYAARDYERHLPPDREERTMVSEEPPTMYGKGSGMHRQAEDM